jgi:predicted Zn-dependent peptidase
MGYEFYITPSGIKICLIEKNELNTIDIIIHLSVGASSEDENELGVAHFLEHMLFTNTKKYTYYQIQHLIAYYGAIINANTNYNKTMYYTFGLSEYTLELFDILYEIFFNNIISTDNIEKEKKIVIQEINNDTLTLGYQSELLAKKIMYNNRYKYLIGAEPQHILSIDINKLNNFKNKHYIPKNTTIIFFGNFDNKKILNEMKTRFGNIKKYNPKFNEMNNKLIQFKNKEKTIIKYIKTNNEQIFINFYFKTITFDNIWFYKILLLNDILTNSLFSILNNKLRYELGLVYNINGNLKINKDSGYYNISLICSKENVKKCIKELLNILHKLQKNTIDDVIIISCKNKLKTDILSNSIKPSIDLDIIMDYLNFNIKILSNNEILDIINNTTKDELNNLCKTLFHPNNTIIIVEGNIDNNK